MKYCRGDIPSPSAFDISRIGKKAYELYHLDFETFRQVVPEFEGARPFVSYIINQTKRDL
jgi:hypothetical protein